MSCLPDGNTFLIPPHLIICFALYGKNILTHHHKLQIPCWKKAAPFEWRKSKSVCPTELHHRTSQQQQPRRNPNTTERLKATVEHVPVTIGLFNSLGEEVVYNLEWRMTAKKCFEVVLKTVMKSESFWVYGGPVYLLELFDFKRSKNHKLAYLLCTE